MLNKKQKKNIRMAGAYIFTVLMVFIAVAPFVYVVLTALKTQEQIYDPKQIIPTYVTFENFRHVIFESNFVRYFMNSIFITAVTTVICMVLSVMAAYGLTRYRILGAGKIKMAVLMTRMFPGILLCIPYYIIMKHFQLIDSYVGLILMYCSFTLPFAIWNTCAFFSTIPWELEESAMIDGCNPLQTFFGVVMPILKPTAITVAILNAMWIWNDYLLPYLVIGLSTNYKTIPVVVQYLVGSYGAKDLGAMMALLVLSVIPIIVFYLTCQKYIIEGVVAGAVKG